MTGALTGRLPTQCGMHAMRVVKRLEFGKFSPQIRGTPEGHLVEILAPQGADEAFHEWVRDRRVGHGLDFIDFEYAQIGFPAVELKQWIVIGTERAGSTVPADSGIEQAA